jgi:hypothetical protein
MENYSTLSEAINELKQKGYTVDFNQWDENGDPKYIDPDKDGEIKVKHFYRFEGTSDAGNNTILYVLETSDGKKGLLVDAFGAYHDNAAPKEVVEHLRITAKAYDK